MGFDNSGVKEQVGKMPLRALALGMVLSVLVTLYSAYAGLKVGGVYWPILTTTIAAMGILAFLGKTDRHEINIAQTAGSAGGLLAAGIIFTIPAFYMLGMKVSLPDIFLVSLSGGLLGVLFSYPLRRELIDQEKLPYPDGTAAASLISSGDEKGDKFKTMAAGFGLGAIVAVLRDLLSAIPGAINLESTKNSAAKLFSFGTAVSLIPIFGGYLIGFALTAAWFSGAIITYFVIVPTLVSGGSFADKAEVVANVAKPIGIGIVIGAALCYFAIVGIPRIRAMVSSLLKKKTKVGEYTQERKWLFGSAILLIALLSVALNLDIGITLIALAGAFAMAYLGARVTGELNVDPMEIFAVIALLVAKVVLGSGAGPLILLAAVVSIAAGVAGDMMQDMKAGRILGTDPKHQLAAQIAGVIVGAAVVGLVISAIGAKYEFGGMDFPAPQAAAIKEVVAGNTGSAMCLKSQQAALLSEFLRGLGINDCIGVGAMLGTLMAISAQFMGSGAMPIAFGIGMYVPIELSLPLFLGGVFRAIADSRGKTEMVRILAAGAIAGEGLIGAIIAIVGSALLFLK